jgi:type IV secretion system protein VirB10
VSWWDRFRLNRTAEATQSAGVADANSAAARPGSEREVPADTVVGERGVASIHRTHSLQSRVSNMLAVGLVSLLALGFLAWYYTQVFARQSRAEHAQTSKSMQQTKGEMALPPLGPVDPPVVERVLGPPPEPPSMAAFAMERFQAHEPRPYVSSSSYGQVPSPTPEQRVEERRLSGPVFVSASTGAAQAQERNTVDSSSFGHGARFPAMASAGAEPNTSVLSGLLEPTSTPAVQAKVLPTQRLLLPKGAFLDCTLETAIDSSLPGMTTCVTATDTFGADGSVVLLERGTKLVGETRGDVRHGSARVYVLWTEARTPEGVVVPLASPGTDELGRAGLPGEVNRHFWERFGAAILVSVIDGAVQAAAQHSSNGDGAVIVNPSTSRDVMTEVLRSTINIPPTVTKPHGDRIAVLVARDLDFRTVYELRPAELKR